jgi:hypothetical protein
VPLYATAPALIMVGLFMMKEVKKIDFANLEQAFPAFIIMVMIALSYSISTGLAFGFISFALIKTVSGKVRDVKPAMWIIAILSILFLTLDRLPDIIDVRHEASYLKCCFLGRIVMGAFNSIKTISFLSVALLITAIQNPASAENSMSISTGENAVTINAGSKLLLRYPYKNVPFKPYVQKLFSPTGVNILRDAPFDHLHHHALMYAIKVDGVNFWEESPTAGRQQNKSFTDVKTDTKTDAENDKRIEIRQASFTELIDWTNQNRELLLKEHRTIHVQQGTDLGATLLTWQSKFELPEGTESATLTGSHYHGLGMRFVKSMDSAGRHFNADGKPGTVFRGDEKLLRSTWCAYTANANGKPVTVAMFDHPKNPRHPATFFTMTKPFAYLSATLNLHKEPLKVVSGKPLVLRYAVTVWDGKVKAERIEKLYRLWTAK